jgi:hypothetical protein
MIALRDMTQRCRGRARKEGKREKGSRASHACRKLETTYKAFRPPNHYLYKQGSVAGGEVVWWVSSTSFWIRFLDLY